MGSHYRIADAPSFGMGTIRNVTVTRPLHVHVHVSGSGGTSLCELARISDMGPLPLYNCQLPLKRHEQWRALLTSERQPRAARSCKGLYVVMQSFSYSFGMIESPAPHWLDCPRVQYSFFMVDPVRRVLRWAYEYCVRRGANGKWDLGSDCDPMGLLRRWYNATAGWVVEGPHWHGQQCYYGTPSVSEYNLRFLLPTVDAFRAPLGALGVADLQKAKRRLHGFRLAIAIDVVSVEELAIHVSAAFGWPRSIQRLGGGAIFDIAKRGMRTAPPEHAALVRAHNPQDVALHAWLSEASIIHGRRTPLEGLLKRR